MTETAGYKYQVGLDGGAREFKWRKIYCGGWDSLACLKGLD